MTQKAGLSSNESPSRRLGLILAVVLGATVLLAVALVRPGMPERVVIMTGPEMSAYHEFGMRLADDVRSRGLKADVIASGGAADNLERLPGLEHSCTVALAPSIVNWRRQQTEQSQLVALGSVGVEPLWLFYRSGLPVNRITDLIGKRVGSEGADTSSFHIAELLIEQAGMTGKVDLVALDDSTAKEIREGFAIGAIDAVFVSGEASSKIVSVLLRAEGVELLSFERAPAYAMRVKGATALVAPEGVLDLAINLPRKDTHLLAASTCLIANTGIHPAVVPMLLSSVENVRQEEPSFLSRQQFPTPDHVTLPLAASAKRYFRQGEVGLAKVLPYQTVRFLNHLGFFVIPLLTVTAVLLKGIPMALKFWCRMRLKQWFKKMAAAEKSWASGADVTELSAELEQLDRATASAFVPMSMTHDYVDFRQFLHDLRERVRTPREVASVEPSD